MARRRMAMALLGLGLLAPMPASAYTIVLRSGARVDIGESYRLSGSRIEYGTSAGARQTLELSAVDLQATARVNNESVSTFVDRASKRAPRASAAPSARPAPSRTIQPDTPDPNEPAVSVTNADLEPYRAERERLDAEYRSRHPEADLAMPVAFPAAAPSYASSYGGARLDEQSWRSQAVAFRDQIDAENAQIDSVRAQVDDRQQRPFKYGLNYEYNFGRAPLLVRNGQYFSLTNPLYPSLRADEEFSQLNSRLIDLEIQHRATVSQWNNFLERARRAGVPPGWLRD